MGQAKDVLLRQQITLDSKLGDSYSSLAVRYGLSYNTVRTICIRYKELGEAGLIPRYANCGRQVAEESERTFRLVRLLKHLHPNWGVGYILVRLRRDYPELPLQSERQYQRRLATGSNRLPKAQLPPSPVVDRCRLPHDTWQIDAKERIGMADGKERCFLNITDEKTASLLKAKGFPPGADLSSSAQ